VNRSDMTISRFGRGECPVCGREFNLTKKGKVRAHVDLSTTAWRGHMWCDGIGQDPREVTA